MRINEANYGLYSYQNQINKSKQINQRKQGSVDNIEISARGQEISQAVKADQIDRQKKIDEIKQKVANGTYHVESQKIAEKLITFWRSSSNKGE
jgi:negative regulator of flagellin synthesis FlgM